jgi:hypothetical protein
MRYPERRRHLLGCVRLPVAMLYQMGILEGTFKVGRQAAGLYWVCHPFVATEA